LTTLATPDLLGTEATLAAILIELHLDFPLDHPPPIETFSLATIALVKHR
jgi:hypothetical protein